MQGVCQSEPPRSLNAKVSKTAPSLQRDPGACIIYVEASFLSIQADTTWLDGLVIVNGPLQNRQQISTMLVLRTGSLFLTNSQLIGSHYSGPRPQVLMRAIAVNARATKAYFESAPAPPSPHLQPCKQALCSKRENPCAPLLRGILISSAAQRQASAACCDTEHTPLMITYVSCLPTAAFHCTACLRHKPSNHRDPIQTSPPHTEPAPRSSAPRLASRAATRHPWTRPHTRPLHPILFFGCHDKHLLASYPKHRYKPCDIECATDRRCPTRARRCLHDLPLATHPHTPTHTHAQL